MDHVIVLVDGERNGGRGHSVPGSRGRADLLRHTLMRADRIVDPERIVVVTTAEQRAETDRCLADWPRVGRIEQPRDRGTVPALLLPILSILEHDPHARIVVLPAEDDVADDDGFVRCITAAMADLRHYPFELLLLGAKLTWPEAGQRWILPKTARGWPRIAAFRESPPLAEVPGLIQEGALANTLVMVGDAWSFAALVLQEVPVWFHALRSALHDPELLARTYNLLPTVNFSERVLDAARSDVRLVPMPPVGWSHTPGRTQGPRSSAPRHSLP